MRFHPGKRSRGSALVEVSLLLPWYLLLSVGTFDVGMYSYDLIAVENAVRVAASYTSKTSATKADQAGACSLVRQELRNLPGVTSTTTCGAAPLTVTAIAATGPDGRDGSKVTVTYRTSQFLRLPMMPAQMNINRTVTMRVKP